MSDACLTINFQSKNVSIDGRAITLENLVNGLFHTEFNQEKKLWIIKNTFKIYGHTGNDIYQTAANGVKIFYYVLG